MRALTVAVTVIHRSASSLDTEVQKRQGAVNDVHILHIRCAGQPHTSSEQLCPSPSTHQSWSSPGTWRDASCRNKTSQHAGYKEFFSKSAKAASQRDHISPQREGENQTWKKGEEMMLPREKTTERQHCSCLKQIYLPSHHKREVHEGFFMDMTACTIG